MPPNVTPDSPLRFATVGLAKVEPTSACPIAPPCSTFCVLHSAAQYVAKLMGIPSENPPMQMFIIEHPQPGQRVKISSDVLEDSLIMCQEQGGVKFSTGLVFHGKHGTAGTSEPIVLTDLTIWKGPPN